MKQYFLNDLVKNFGNINPQFLDFCKENFEFVNELLESELVFNNARDISLLKDSLMMYLTKQYVG